MMADSSAPVIELCLLNISYALRFIFRLLLQVSNLELAGVASNNTPVGYEMALEILARAAAP